MKNPLDSYIDSNVNISNFDQLIQHRDNTNLGIQGLHGQEFQINPNTIIFNSVTDKIPQMTESDEMISKKNDNEYINDNFNSKIQSFKEQLQKSEEAQLKIKSQNND